MSPFFPKTVQLGKNPDSVVSPSKQVGGDCGAGRKDSKRILQSAGLIVVHCGQFSNLIFLDPNFSSASFSSRWNESDVSRSWSIT